MFLWMSVRHLQANNREMTTFAEPCNECNDRGKSETQPGRTPTGACNNAPFSEGFLEGSRDSRDWFREGSTKGS